MGALEFQIDLTGNMSSSLEGVNKNLGGTEKGMKHAKEGVHLFEAELGKASASAAGFSFNLSALAKGGSLFTFDLAEGASLAFEALHKVGELIFDLGKDLIKTAGHAEDLNLALELNVGKEGAEQFAELAESFQRTTKFSAAQMKEAWLPLLDVGIKGKDLIDDMSTAAADIEARTGGGVGKVNAVLETFRGMFLKDQISKTTFTTLGIQANEFYGAIAEHQKVSVSEAEKLIKAHKVDKQVLIDTALDLVAHREGGSLGSGGLRGAETLGGTLTRLGNLTETIFEKAAGSPGMKAIQGMLSNFIDVMGKVGPEIIDRVGVQFKTLFGDLAGPGGVDKMRAIVDVIADKVGVLIDGMQHIPKIIDQIVTGVEILGVVWAGSSIVTGIAAMGVLAAPVLAIGVAIGGIAAAVYRVNDALKELGGMTRVLDDLKFWATGTSATANNSVNENSPAWKKAKAAAGLLPSDGDPASAAAFMGAPKFASGGIVSRPTLALVGEAGPEAVVPLGRGLGSFTGGGQSVTIEYAPQFIMGAGANAKEIAGEAERDLRTNLKRILEEAGLAFGSAA